MKSVLKKIIILILTFEAKLVLKKYNPKIIAVTGSVGKTSAKDAIFDVISSNFFARKSHKSFNSELGVPLTVLDLPNGWNNPLVWLKNVIDGLILVILPNRYPSWLVLEIGADRVGDIQSITNWVKPDIAVVTRMGKVPVHVEFFRSIEEVLLEKSFIVRGMKRSGMLVLNSDDEDVLKFKELTDNNTITFGTENPTDVLGQELSVVYDESDKPKGIKFNVAHDGHVSDIFVDGALGIQQMFPVLAGVSVGLGAGMSFKEACKAVKNYKPSSGRMKILKGIKNSTIIDDTYNSSPVATEEALSTLKSINPKGRKIAILGDMLELGIYSTESHKIVGKISAKTTDFLVTVGIRSRFIAEGALNAGMDENKILQFEDPLSAGKEIQNIIEEGDVILVKGSQGSRMEKVVEEIMAEPNRRGELLVRQDEEWKNR